METSLSSREFELPGFRFHPTEEELLNYYLRSMVFGKKLRGDIIGFLNIYKHDPRELPGLAQIDGREWYFFVPRDRKNRSGLGRPNRTTETGFWKATGSDRKILSTMDPMKILGLKKTLVFYEGRAPRGRKTDWIMNEYRLPDSTCSPPKDVVLCKIYRKATSMKVLEQRAAMEEESFSSYNNYSSPPMDSSASFCSQFDRDSIFENGKRKINDGGLENLTELQLPSFSMDWNLESFWTLENLSPYLPLC